MVTIIMAAYNGEQYIREQLESMKGQTYRDWKLIIRDDGSTDRTVDIIQAFRQETEQEVVLYENKPSSGSAKENFFRLLKDADDSYIMFCDQDDIWKKDKILHTLQYMQQLETDASIPVLVHSDLTVIDENGTVKADSFFAYQNLSKTMELSHLLVQNTVTGCTMMINRSLRNHMLEAISHEKIIMHDYWAALYAAVYGKIGLLSESTMYYRQHAHNSVGAKASNSITRLWGRLLEGRKQYKNSMAESFEQIAYFLECTKQMQTAPAKRELLEGYAALKTKGKWNRVRFYYKNKTLKHGTVRVLIQYLWG